MRVNIIITFLCFCSIKGISQVSNLPLIFPTDTTTRLNDTTIIARTFDMVNIENDSLLVNDGLNYIAKYYSFKIDVDSAMKLADTIIYVKDRVYFEDTLTNTIYDSLPMRVGFYWIKKIPFSSTLLDYSTRLYGTPGTCQFYYHSIWAQMAGNTWYSPDNTDCYQTLICHLGHDQTINWCSNYQYTKVFEDNFDGTTLDKTHWNISVAAGERTIATGYVLDKNVEVSNGTLKLMARYDPGQLDNDGTQYPQDKDFNFGSIASKAAFSFGKFEIRAKIPPIVGVNPAFWLFSEIVEIDAFEFFYMNRGDDPTFSLYSKINPAGNPAACNAYDGKIRVLQKNVLMDNVWSSLPNLADGQFHTFTLVYDPNYITWIFEHNGTQYIYTFYDIVQSNYTPTYPNGNCSCTGCYYKKIRNFPDQDQNKIQVIIDNGLYGSKDYDHAPHNPMQTGPYPGPPSVMEVDWIKIYQTDFCGINPNISQGSSYIPNNSNQCSITGDHISLGGPPGSNFSVYHSWFDINDYSTYDPNHILFVRANQEVALLNGFEVQENAGFSATIAVPFDCSGDLNNTFTQYDRSANTEVKNNALMSNATDLDLSIYPNPSTNELFFKGNINYSAIEIVDLNSKLCKKIIGEVHRVDISDLSPGIYFVRYIGNNKVIIRKFLKI